MNTAFILRRQKAPAFNGGNGFAPLSINFCQQTPASSPERSQRDRLEKLISIVIPAKNAEKTIKKCVDSLFNLSYQNLEVIIANDGSSDSTTEILQGISKIKVISIAGVGPSAARNIALKEAQGEFIAFTDADCVVASDWLDELYQGFNDDKVAGVGGIQQSPADESWFGRQVQGFLNAAGFITDYMRWGKSLREVKHNPSCNVMYRRGVLEEVGGFQQGLWPGEDVELDYRLRQKGYKLIFNPQAVVYHYRCSNLRDFTRMMFRYGFTQGVLSRRYGLFRKLHIFPLVTTFLMISFLYLFFLNIRIFLASLLIILLAGLVYFSFNPVTLFLAAIALICWQWGFLKGMAAFKPRRIFP